MPDLKISELPAANALADNDLTPLVQSSGGLVTRRANLSQIRAAVLAERGLHVRDFGAVGNGVADDGPAIQAAINALGAAGGVVFLGARTYRINTPITVTSASVRIQGQGFTEGGSPGEGTWLTVGNPSIFPITFQGPGARGSAVRDLAVRESHTAAQNASWAPTAYNFFFRVVDCLGGVDFDNILLSGVNRGFLVKNSGRTDFRRIRGQVFTTGIEMDEAYDTGRMLSLHFWPFWSANDNVVRWQQNNGDALVFRRVDGVFVDQAFALGYRSMFRFTSSSAGFTQKFSIGQAYADFVRHGLWIDAAGTDGQVDALTVQCELWNANGAPLPGSVGIYVNANTSRVQIGQLRIDDVEDNAIRLEGHSNRLDIGALRVVHFNLRNNGSAAVHLAASGANPPNRVNLAATPLLEGVTNNGPLLNAGTNGGVGVLAPAGSVARPGLALGAGDAGLSQPAAGALAASAGGAELLRLSAGLATLGAAPGAHGLEVATPAGAANRLRAQAAGAGGAAALQAAGADAQVELSLEAKGASPVSLRAGGALQAQVAPGASAVNHLVLSGGATGTPGRVVLQAAGADANVGLVLAPRGTGALMAQAPDGAASGGNERGANAVDWQVARNAASQVASAANSVVCGGRNNTASGVNSVVAGGDWNVAGGPGAAILGGWNNSASGVRSWVPGGERGSTRADVGRGAWSSGMFSTTGDAQSGEFVLRRATTDAAPARLTANDAAPSPSNTLNLPPNATYRMRLLVVAKQVGGTAGTPGDCASWEASVLLRRGAGVAQTVLVGGHRVTAAPGIAAVAAGTGFAPSTADASAAGWLLTLAADTANGGLAVSGTGEANKTIRWVARVMSVEVTA